MLKGELAHIQERKKELLLESDINRQILRVEYCQLKLKASEWKRGLLKARTAYHWMAPLAGIGFAVYGMRKKLHLRRKAAHNGNGHPHSKAAYLNLLAPLGIAAMRQAMTFWRRHAKKRGTTA